VLRAPGSEATLLADLLPDWYDDWLETERERIRQLRLAELERNGERLLASGHAAEGIQLGLRAAALEPLRESAQRLVIRCHLAEGNLIEAIRQYERFAALLARELGAMPSARMADLIRPCRAPARGVAAENRVTICDLDVLVDEAAKPVSPRDVPSGAAAGTRVHRR